MSKELPLRAITLDKYRAVQRRFQELYEEKRLRIDDVEAQLCAEFFIGRGRLQAIMKMELPKNPTLMEISESQRVA